MIKKAKNSPIQSSKYILGGEPVFRGTRVPICTLMDYLKGGDRLSDFLKDYPTVTKRQVIDVLEVAKKNVTKR